MAETDSNYVLKALTFLVQIRSPNPWRECRAYPPDITVPRHALTEQNQGPPFNQSDAAGSVAGTVRRNSS